MPAVEFFVDESRRRDYLLCAAVATDGNIESARRVMRDLKPRNRNRLHIKDETRNRDRLVSEFVRLRPITQAHVFIGTMHGTRRTEREVRSRCLDALACYAANAGATRILVGRTAWAGTSAASSHRWSPCTMCSRYARAGRPRKTCGLPAPLPRLFAETSCTLHGKDIIGARRTPRMRETQKRRTTKD